MYSGLLHRKHSMRDLVSRKHQTEVRTHTLPQSLRQRTELVLDLSPLIKPIRIILCTDEGNLTRAILSRPHRHVQHAHAYTHIQMQIHMYMHCNYCIYTHLFSDIGYSKFSVAQVTRKV